MRVLYFTPSSFRTVNAGALRNANLATALALRGHEVVIVSGDSPLDEQDPHWSRTLHSGVRLSGGGGERRVSSVMAKVRRLVEGPTSERIDDSPPPNVVIAYNPGPLQFRRIEDFARRHRVPVLIDLSEWLASTDLPGSRWSPYSWWYEVFMRRLPRRIKWGIAISNPMADHLRSRGAEVLVVPPLSTVSPDQSVVRRTGERIRVVVSGSGISASGKDVLAIEAFVHAISTAPDIHDQFELTVMGDLDASTAHLLDGISTFVPINRLGWVPWVKSVRALHEADYLAVLRDRSIRRHRLGYPSKVSEALSAGTKVVVNKCGDLGRVEPAEATVVVDDGPGGMVDSLRDIAQAARADSTLNDIVTALAPSDWAVAIEAHLTMAIEQQRHQGQRRGSS